MRIRPRHSTVLATLLLLSGIAAPCRMAAAEGEGDTLHCSYSSAMFSELNMQDAKAASKVWADSFIRKCASFRFKQSDTTIFSNLDEMDRAIARDQVDLMVMVGPDFFRLEKKYPLKIFAVGINDTPGFYEMGIYANRGDSHADLAHLRGKKLIVDTGMEGGITGMWLDVTLARNNEPTSASFFSGVKSVNKASKAIMPVFFKQADACLIRVSAFNAMVELNPQVGRQMTLILKSPAYHGAMLVYHPKLDEQTKEHISENLMKLEQDPEGKQILTLFKCDRVAPFDETAHLKALRELYQAYDNLGKAKPAQHDNR